MKVDDVFTTKFEIITKNFPPRRWRIIDIAKPYCTYIGLQGRKRKHTVKIHEIEEHFESGAWVIVTPPKLKRI